MFLYKKFVFLLLQLKKAALMPLFYGVDKLPKMEPFSYSTKILYSELISIMKQSTQEYYNMRMILDLECA